MKKDVFKKFESIGEFTKHLEDNDIKPGFTPESYDGDYTFTRTHSYESANEKLLYGDKNMASVINRRAGDIVKLKINKYKNRRTYSSAVVGAVPHVPNYIAGCPNAMIRQTIKRVKAPVVTIGYNMAVPGCVDARDIFDVCVNLIAAIKCVEAQGIRVNLYSTSYSHTDDNNHVAFAIKLKDSGKPLDVMKMAYPLGHPSMNRRHKFRFMEITEGVPQSFAGGYGYAERSEKKSLSYFSSHGIKFDRIFDFSSLKYLTVEQIAEKICAEADK